MISVQALQSRPRLLLCALLGIATWAVLPQFMALQEVTRIIVGWNAGACLYLGLVAWMIGNSSHERMRQRALKQDDGKKAILALVVISALMCLTCLVLELSVAKDLHGTSRSLHIALAGLTVFTSWAFTQVMFALHYAHDYYVAVTAGRAGGLAFPGEHAPDYGDFVYFACVIGTSGQTADVSFTSRSMRRTGLLHCVLAFFFNTTLVALTINIASGLV
jgi:uncharacterized membrane protein